MKKYFFIALFSAIFLSSANAQICYEQVIDIPAGTWDCEGSSSSSTDFTVGCSQTTNDTYTTVEIPCVAIPMWVPVPAHWAFNGIDSGNQSARGGMICEFYGYESTTINGRTCASAALQPQSGTGAELINHHLHIGPGSYTISNNGGTNWGLRKVGLHSAYGLCQNSPVDYLSSDTSLENIVTARACLVPQN